MTPSHTAAARDAPGALLARCDAGGDRGLGHAMRCHALAQAWRELGGDTAFLVAAAPRSFLERLRGEGHAVQLIAAEPGSQEDGERTRKVAARQAAAWLAIDGYAFGPTFADALGDPPCRLLWLDDGGEEQQPPPLRADAVLWPGPQAEPDRYRDRPWRGRRLLGARYALLGEAYRTESDRLRPAAHRARRRIVVSFGGSDPGGHTQRVLEALAELPDATDLAVTAVLGPDAPPLEPIRARPRGPRIEVVRDPPDLPARLAAADLAIAAAGSTALELAALGVPSLLVSVADNQRGVAAGLAAAGAAVDLGPAAELTTARLAAEAASLAGDPARRRALGERARELIDGRGAVRVADVLRLPLLALRPAVPEDADRLWKWANDAETRSRSFSSEPIPWERHVSWLADRLQDPACLLLIGEDEGRVPVGQVRFDLGRDPETGTKGGRAILSVGVAPEHRGRGVGRALVGTGVEGLFTETNVARVDALVKPDNSASLRLFAKEGFRRRAPVEVAGQPSERLTLERPGTSAAENAPRTKEAS